MSREEKAYVAAGGPDSAVFVNTDTVTGALDAGPFAAAVAVVPLVSDAAMERRSELIEVILAGSDLSTRR